MIRLIAFLFSLNLISSESNMPVELSYGDNELQKVDFYKGTNDKVLVWIHGGGWLFGNKRADRWIKRFNKHFPSEDTNVFMIGYRVGKNTSPNAINDVLCAYKRIEKEVDALGLSSKDIIVSGASAGGHLALMLGFADSTNYQSGCLPEHRPKLIINLFGITELEQTSIFLDENKFFSSSNYVRSWIPDDINISEATKKYSPIYLINEHSPMTLTIHGTADSWVPFDQALLLNDAMEKKHELLAIENGGHYGFSEDENKIIRKKIQDFIFLIHNN
tara:strand:+ start:2940 stop:3764 length:825 start_codon:yes stop_codon:yes gene_type:complete